MFRSVLETMLAIQVRLRRRGLVIRQMLAEFRPAWAVVPLEHGYPAIPATWRSAHKFVPVVTYYGGKVLSKAFPRFSNRRDKGPAQPGRPPARLTLWAQEQVREILDPRGMNLNGPLDTGTLEEFLKQSQERRFDFDAEWSRLLSLEYTLRAILEQTRRRQSS